MKKTILIILYLVLLCSLVACGAESLNNQNEKNWRNYPIEDGIVIDGKFNEVQYNNLMPLKYINGNKEINMSVFLGKKGIYIKSNITDDALFYNTKRPMFQNSCIIFYIAPYLAGKEPKFDNKTVQVRIGINGTTEQWVGNSSENNYIQTNISALSHIVLKNKQKDVDFIKGNDIELKQNITGYKVEVFLPYSNLGLKDKPENILIMPEMIKCFSFKDNQCESIHPEKMLNNMPMTFGAFGSVGYNKDGVVDGANMGKSDKFPTYGWDITKDSKEDNKVVKQTGAQEQKIYFKNLYEKKYAIEAEITVKKTLNNDDYPKFGLLAAENEFNSLAFFVDPFNTLSNKWVVSASRNDSNDEWIWTGNIKEFPQMNYTNGEKVKLEVIRDGTKFFFVVNGELAGYNMTLNGLDENSKSYAGFMTMNIEADYTNYKATVDTVEIDKKIINLINLAKDKNIDGDLTDWSNLDRANKISVYGIDDSLQGFDVYGKYIGDDGLYLAGEASHKTNVIGNKHWFKNVNFEFYLQNENKQKWIMKGNSSYLFSKMNTVNDNQEFKTYFEIFIPEKDLPVSVTNKDYIKIGFALNVPGEFIKLSNNSKNLLTDKWCPKGNNPSNEKEMFFVYDDGIHVSEKLI